MAEQVKHTALFFGSYNPVHAAHLIMAQSVLLFGGVDDVWLVVSPHNPFKEREGLAPADHRLKMLQLATSEDERIAVCDAELRLPVPSYTIRTIELLEAENPDRRFALVMGADNIPGLPRWREAEKLLKGRRLIVCPRPGTPLDLSEVEALGAEVTVVEAPLLDISSTNIRKWVAQGLDVANFVPRPVAKYIAECGLYK